MYISHVISELLQARSKSVCVLRHRNTWAYVTESDNRPLALKCGGVQDGQMEQAGGPGGCLRHNESGHGIVTRPEKTHCGIERKNDTSINPRIGLPG